MPKWEIEWYSIVPRHSGVDEIEARDVGDARRRWVAKYPGRHIAAIIKVEPVRRAIELARVE